MVSRFCDIDIKGYETKCGTLFLNDNNPAAEDAEVVRRFRAAGAMILGHTRMHELGFDVTNNNPREGTPRNPYNVNHYTGGSSGGSACAVAAGLCPIAIGDDGGGSIRIPSSHCGVFGMKPSYGRASRYGDFPLGFSVGYVGPIAATAEDLALAYSVMAGPDPKDSATSVPPPMSLRNLRQTDSLIGLRVGYHPAWVDIAAPDLRAACRRHLQQFSDLGASVVEVEVPNLDETRVAHLITIGSEFVVCSRRYGSNRSKLGLPVQMNLAVLENAVNSADFVQAQQVRARTMADLEALFENIDVLVTPTTGLTAPEILPGALAVGESNMRVSSRVMVSRP